MKLKKGMTGNLHVVETAGFKLKKNEKNVNKRAGLGKNKEKNSTESVVKRRKPLALKHVRRMRKAALALSCVLVGIISYIGVGFFIKSPVEELPEADYATVCIAPPSDGGSPLSYSVVETVGFMNYVLQNQPYWSSEMQSTVYTVMQQKVRTYKQYYNGVWISADIAEGVSSEATQFCVSDNVVLWRSSANKNFDGMNTAWSAKQPQGCTVQQFKKRRGLPPSEFSVYILNENTIKNANDYSVKDNGNGTYTVTLELNVNMQDGINAADYYYKQQMYVTGGLDERPVIDWTTIEYTFDDSWRVLDFTINDSYSVKMMGLNPPCTSTTKTVFSYDESRAVNTFYDDYFKHYINNFAEDDENENPEPSAVNYLAAAFGSVLSEGATFKINLGIDDLDLDGAVHVGLDNGTLSDIRVVLGDISAFVEDGKILYVSDGNAKYKLDVGAFLPDSLGETEGECETVFDLNSLMQQLTGGTFEVNEDGATLDSVLELFGFEIKLHFSFEIVDGKISLDYVGAEIPVGKTQLKARLSFGTKDDIPVKPADMSGYTDVLNEGLTLDAAVSIDNLLLNGLIKINMSGGVFSGLYANLGDIAVLYDCPSNMLYLTDGNVKYKLNIDAISGEGVDFSGIKLDSNSLLAQILNNLSASGGTVSTSATLNILEQTISAALAVKLTGGITVGADIEALGHKVKATVGLSSQTVEEPNLDEYVDILNEGVTLSVDLAIDNFKLNGLVYIGLSGGKLTEVRADFGDIKVYYINNELYITDGVVKYKVAIPSANSTANLDLSGFDFKDILNNLVFENGSISTNASLNLFEQTISAAVAVKLTGGISVGADIEALGHEVKATVGLSSQTVEEPNLDEYVDILNEGVTLSVDLAIDNFKLNGLVYIGLSEGKLTEVRADFGDIKVYYINNELYVTDGVVKYKVSIPSANSTAHLDLSGFDFKNILNNLVFTDGSVSTNTTLNIFEQTISAALAVKLTGGISVGADIEALGYKVKATVGLSNEEVALPNLNYYVDILNEGVTLSVDLAIDNFKLNGLVYIGLSGDKLTEVRADLGDIKVYYINNELYITDGVVKYKVSIPSVSSTANLDLSGFDFKDILNNLVFADGKISASLGLNDVLGETLEAVLEIGFKGGLKVNANLDIFNKSIVVSAEFSTSEVVLPDLNDYADILNEGITLDVKLVIDEKANLGDGEIALDGLVFVGFTCGEFTEIRADFGEIAAYYKTAEQLLYLKVGTTKLKIDISGLESGADFGLSSLLPEDTATAVCGLLNNLVAELKEISIRYEIDLMDAIVPLYAILNIENGISAEIGAELVGIKVTGKIGFTLKEVPALTDGEKEEYIDLVNNIWGAVESLIGDNITAEVSGRIYSYDNSKYAQYGYVKYNFNASLEYDFNSKGYGEDGSEFKKPAVNIKPGIVNENGKREGMSVSVDSEIYLHFALNLVAASPLDDSLSLDIVVMDANPVTSSRGVTNGGYTKDNALDVYVSVSKYTLNSPNYDPLKIYAPMDEIMTLLAMAGAAANLDNLSFKDNQALNGAVAEIAGLIDSLLIENYIPHTKDQFSSLGESLIPQILGMSLREYLEEILSSLATAVSEDEREESKISADGSKKFVLSDGYISDIAVGNDSLRIKLNSSLIYNIEMPEDDWLEVEFNKAKFEDGKERLTDISLKNVYFGENNINELDLKLGLKYGAIQRPDETNGLSGYTDFNGIDTLLKAFVNSATHKTDGDTNYALNHYYLLNGAINVNISVGIKINVNININSLAIYVDEKTNDVSVDAHISYDGVQELNQVAINGDTDLYMSIRNDMIYLKRVQKTYWKTTVLWTSKVTYDTPVVEYRIMPVSAFLADIMNQVNFMFNFGSLIANQLSKLDLSGDSGVSFDNKDLGAAFKYVLAYYTYSETQNSASWTVAINSRLLSDAVGMEMTDIPVTFKADKNADGTFTVKGLEIAQSTMKLLGNVATLNFSGYLNYCNPYEVMQDGVIDSSLPLDSCETAELSGISWNNVLGGNSFEEISKVINWNLLSADTGINYITYGNGSPFATARLRYLYATNESNTEFAQWGDTCYVLYNKNTGNVYTYSNAPGLDTLMPKVENKTAVWKSEFEIEDGTLVLRAVYDTTYKVAIDSVYPTDDDYVYDSDTGLWNNTVEEAYEKVLLPVNVYYTDGNNSTYGLKYYVDASGNVCSFDKTAYNAYGELCFVAEVAGGAHYTAVWERVYEVKFIAEFNGVRQEISEYYYEGDIVNDNLPEVPAIGGYTGKWLVGENTVVTPEVDYIFNAEYTVNSYTLKIVSSQAVTNEGFESLEGGYESANSYLYATAVSLEELAPVSAVYSFKGFYDNPEFKGNPVTEFIVTGDKTYYAKWEGKAINVTYKSDLQFGNANLAEDNFYTFSVTMRYGASDNLANYTKEGYVFLGWYMNNGEAYEYVASADALKAALESAAAISESVNITLIAVWAIDNIEINLTKVSGTAWAFEGTYTVNYADGMSSTIAESANIQCSVSVKYYAHGNKLFGGAFSYDEIGTATFNSASNSLNKSGMTCGNGIGGKNLKGSVTVKASFSCGGAALGETGEYEQFRNKS